MFTDAPLYNSARVLPLGPIATDAFAVFIQERFEATSNRITPEGIEHLLGFTGGHPHDTQKLAYFVWKLGAGG